MMTEKEHRVHSSCALPFWTSVQVKTVQGLLDEKLQLPREHHMPGTAVELSLDVFI